MFKFCTRNGVLYDDDGAEVGAGYSGHGDGVNNPALQAVRCVGPIPEGAWTILGPPEDKTPHGDYVLRLVPKPGTDTLGRGGFLIHGDRRAGPAHMASEGCIILELHIRKLVWNSGDRDLLVVTEPPEPLNAAA